MVLTGCSLLSKEKPTVEVAQPIIPIRIICPEPPRVDNLALDRVAPMSVITEEQEILVGLSPDDYAKLGKNMQAILKTLKQKNSVIFYYRSCIDGIDSLQK